jgi:hypothetical protein
MVEMISPAEQVTRVATLLGRAVLRWKREKEQSLEISGIVSDSLPERLEFSPVSSLSVTGQNDEAMRTVIRRGQPVGWPKRSNNLTHRYRKR